MLRGPSHPRRRTRRVAGAAAVAVVLFAPVGRSEELARVRVRVSEHRLPGRVAYWYAVENDSRSGAIVALRIGEDARRGRAQLRRAPLGWSDDKGLPLGSALAPDGWTVEAVREDDAPLWFVDWFTDDTDDALDIAPGQMRDGFSLVLIDSAPEYLTASWTVVFDNGRRLSGTVEPARR
jgi:hypothetical protein